MSRATPKNNTLKGSLVLIPTPIGNLSDMSTRAVEVLKSSDLIACEDTRTSGKLLSHYGIDRPKVSYHEFNERTQSSKLVERIERGETIALISDAGSPGIADPAYRLVRAAVEAGAKVSALPGPCAAITALTASGLPTDRFFFEGFLPHKSGARQRRFEAVRELAHTLIFYESPHRIVKSLTDALSILGDRQACLARELTKLYEEYIRGTLSGLLEAAMKRTLKGEMVLLIAGYQAEGTKESEQDFNYEVDEDVESIETSDSAE